MNPIGRKKFELDTPGLVLDLDAVGREPPEDAVAGQGRRQIAAPARQDPQVHYARQDADRQRGDRHLRRQALGGRGPGGRRDFRGAPDRPDRGPREGRPAGRPARAGLLPDGGARLPGRDRAARTAPGREATPTWTCCWTSTSATGAPVCRRTRPRAWPTASWPARGSGCAASRPMPATCSTSRVTWTAGPPRARGSNRRRPSSTSSGSAAIPARSSARPGTGTAQIDLSVHEVTELQAGSYALMDAEYLAIESADGSDAPDYRPGPDAADHRRERTARPAGDDGCGAESALPRRRPAAGAQPRIRRAAVRLVRRRVRPDFGPGSLHHAARDRCRNRAGRLPLRPHREPLRPLSPHARREGRRCLADRSARLLPVNGRSGRPAPATKASHPRPNLL